MLIHVQFCVHEQKSSVKIKTEVCQVPYKTGDSSSRKTGHDRNYWSILCLR